MFYYRVKISYKGTNFRGWQAQSRDCADEERPTIQGTIHRVLKRISNYQDCSIAGTSRTDAGVHARGQVGKVSIPVNLEAARLLQGMNSLLPPDIRILECTPCQREFNPKTGAASKEYHYYFSLSEVSDPVVSDFVAHVPGPLDLESMERAARLFVGTHDYFNFYRRGSPAATTVRSVLRCEFVAATLSPIAEDVYYLKIVGTGFLKQMVRYIAGTLFDVGRGRVSLLQVAQYLSDHYDDKLSPKAKPHGLHLVRIDGLP